VADNIINGKAKYQLWRRVSYWFNIAEDHCITIN